MFSAIVFSVRSASDFLDSVAQLRFDLRLTQQHEQFLVARNENFRRRNEIFRQLNDRYRQVNMQLTTERNALRNLLRLERLEIQAGRQLFLEHLALQIRLETAEDALEASVETNRRVILENIDLGDEIDQLLIRINIMDRQLSAARGWQKRYKDKNLNLENRLQALKNEKKNDAKLQTTCLYDLHTKYNGKLVPFAGYNLPVQYADLSVKDSAIHTRQHVSIFDVSFMLQTHITGKDRVAFIESLTTADVEVLAPNSGTLSVFTNEKGGIKDDVIVTKTDQEFLYMVTNAGCMPYIQENAAKWRANGKDIEIKSLDGRGLVAVQGPEMAAILEKETDIDLSELTFMRTDVGKVFGIDGCRVTRCGYTGEDGVEISVDPRHAATLVERILESKNGVAKLAGLGARDALRMEAGLCLYGNDIDEGTTPIEAGLDFVVDTRRRQTMDFPGAAKIVEQLQKKNWPRRRVGLISDVYCSPGSRLPLIHPIDKAAVGFVTSGCPSPCLGKNIAIAYVDSYCSKEGTELVVDFGSKQSKVTVTKMPFLKTNYFTGK